MFFSPPTDYDGGPMLAYNIGFFYPLIFLSILLSIIVVFRLKYFKKNNTAKALLILSILPSSYFLFLIIVKSILIATEPEVLDLEILNNTINLNVNDSLEIKLHGYTKRTLNDNEEVITVKIINLVPYINDTYSFKDGGKFTVRSRDPEIFYKIEKDTLKIINKGYEFNYFNKTRVPLPYKIENIGSDSINKDQLKRLNFKNFIWDEYYH